MNLSTLYKKLTNRKYTIQYKFILSLFVGLIGVTSFCNAETGDLIKGISETKGTTQTRTATVTQNIYSAGSFTSEGDTYLFYNHTSSDLYLCVYSVLGSYVEGAYAQGEFTVSGGEGNHFCYIMPYSENSWYSIVKGSHYRVDVSLIPNGNMTSSECQEEYDLIPIEDVDTNYCVENELCPNVSGSGRSNLFINNIEYPGTPTIEITIPEEIQRDQNTDEEVTNIDIIGYGYDQDKMQQMVNTQYYKPTAEEMSGLMEKVADFLPLVAVALLIARIRRVIKKIF